MYEKAKTHFGKMKKKEQKVDAKIITNQLTLISKDISSEDISKISDAQDMLNFMLNLSSLEVETQIIKYLNGNISHEIFACFVKAYARKMTQIIESKGNFNEVLQIWKNQDESKVIEYTSSINYTCILTYIYYFSWNQFWKKFVYIISLKIILKNSLCIL